MNITGMQATALIAEDEPLLAANLKAELRALWPALNIVASVTHGEAAVQQALALRPQLLFLDIRMPGMTGLEAAQAIAEDWPDDGTPLPALVFVTAYDEYALQAFEQAAVDYVLKPVQPARLAQTCTRVQAVLAQRASGGGGAIDAAIDQLRQLLGSSGPTAPAAPTTPGAPLTVIQAAVGNAIHLVPVVDVLYFEAADKYVRVVTLEREYLVRISLRELLPQIDLQRFWQIHRGTVVRSDAIATALRDEAGKITLTLRGHADRLAVSRLYAQLFKPM
jgi:DNA-binding LytR/AlgR family response regulator